VTGPRLAAWLDAAETQAILAIDRLGPELASRSFGKKSAGKKLLKR